VIGTVGPVLDRLALEHAHGDQIGPRGAGDLAEPGHVVTAPKVTAETGDDHDGLPVTAVDPDEPPPGQQPVADQAGEGRPVEEGPRGYGQGDRAEQGRRHGPAVDVPGSAEDGRDGGGDGMAPDRTDEPGEQAPGEDDDGEKGGSGDDGRAEDD